MHVNTRFWVCLYPERVFSKKEDITMSKFCLEGCRVCCADLMYPEFEERITSDHSNDMADLSKQILDKIQDVGRAEQKLLDILEDDIFKKTSKHNPYWESNLEEEADKLDELRMKFACLHDNLWDVIGILRDKE